MFHVFSAGVEKRVERVLVYLGGVSLPIYVLHILFVIQMPAIGQLFLNQNAVTSITLQIVFSLLFSIIAIVLSIVIYRVLRISALIRLLLFGEK